MKIINKQAFTMIEIMAAICIFALAVLPMIWLGTSQTQGTYSAGKHMMAGQLAASYMDNILKRPYEEIEKDDFPTEIKHKVLASNADSSKTFVLSELINGLENNEETRSAKENIEASFRNFRYEINIDKSSKAKKIIKIDIKVFYRIVEKSTKEEYVELHAIKFGDTNG